MKAHIELGSRGALGAAQRGDVIVLIDALRASTTIISALVAGASRVIPALTVEESLALRRQSDHLVAGERGGIKVDGFDFGNSPTELLTRRDELDGRPLILTTSNGTRCVKVGLSNGAPAILVAAPPNATAAVHAAWDLAGQLNRDITLLAAGLDDAPNDEDTFTAQVLLQMLEAEHGVARMYPEEEAVSVAESWRIFTHSEAGRRLSRLGYAEDVEFCAQFDTLDLVPVYRDEMGFVPMDADRTQLREETESV